MRFAQRLASVAAALLLAVPVAAQTLERQTDKDVKDLIESVGQALDRFEDQLDGKVKGEIIRSSTGEIDVSARLSDFEQETERLKSRFTDKYAASAEVQSVLRRGADVGTMMKALPTGTKGASEWDALAVQLGRLAAAYATDFPMREGAAVRRINDEEAAATAELVVKQAEQIKKTVDADKTMNAPDRTALASEVDEVIKQSKVLRSRLSDSKPTTADARALAEKIEALLKEGRELPPAVLTGIGSLRAPLLRLRQAFGGGPAT